MRNAVGAANEEEVDLRVGRVSAGAFWIGLLGTVFLAKLLLAWRFPGFLTGDDLEVLQTAAKYAWGLDYQPWGLRCLFHPLTFVRPFLELAYDLGTRDPVVLSWLGTVPAAAASTAGAWLLHTFARGRGLPESGSRAAAFLYAFHWLPLGYGATHYPRPISAALLLAAFVLASRTSPRPASDAVAGALAAAAFATRWSEGVVLVVLLVWTWYLRRDLRALARILAGFAAGAALLIGVFDALTWGEPFASLREYFGLIQVGAPPSSPSTDQPFFWYFTTPLRWAGPLALLLAAVGWKDRRGREALAILAGILLLLSFFPYKAWRYLHSAIPFLALASAVGWLRVRNLQRGGRFLAAVALVLAVPIGLERTWTLLRDKSQSAIAAARYIAALRPQPRVVALEQAWAFGERIYLGNGPRIREIPVSRPLSPETVRREASGADVVAIYSKDTSSEVLAVLADLGFRETARFKRDTSREVVVYFAGRARSRAF